MPIRLALKILALRLAIKRHGDIGDSRSFAATMANGQRQNLVRGTVKAAGQHKARRQQHFHAQSQRHRESGKTAIGQTEGAYPMHGPPGISAANAFVSPFDAR